MDISTRYTTEAKILADKEGVEVKKIVLSENDFLFAELLTQISDEVRAMRLK